VAAYQNAHPYQWLPQTRCSFYGYTEAELWKYPQAHWQTVFFIFATLTIVGVLLELVFHWWTKGKHRKHAPAAVLVKVDPWS
jgi:hypothetical protein